MAALLRMNKMLVNMHITETATSCSRSRSLPYTYRCHPLSFRGRVMLTTALLRKKSLYPKPRFYPSKAFTPMKTISEGVECHHTRPPPCCRPKLLKCPKARSKSKQKNRKPSTPTNNTGFGLLYRAFFR